MTHPAHIDVNILQDNVLNTFLGNSSPGEKYKAANELYALYSSITGITAHTHTDVSMKLSTGIAISASAAAHCLLEFARTSAFLRGIHQAINELTIRFPGERLRILYAGCGPYAALITPLLKRYTPADLSIDLLDITPKSIASVKRLYETLGLESYVNEYLITDATTYRIKEEPPVRLLISETLNAGLKNEPFISIMQNLIPQLPKGAIVIPEKITIHAAFLHIGREVQRLTQPETELQRLFVARLADFSKTNIHTPSPITITIPPIDIVANKLHLMTLIDVYGGELLKEYDCSLTLPLLIKLMGAAPGDELKFTYLVSEKPGFVAELFKK